MSIYDNCVIQAPDGTPVSRCKRNKLEWHLSRGLATRIDENTIRLHKPPSGVSNLQEAIEAKENICAVCGETNKLTRHHIVPYCFRHALPNEWRSSAALFHDLVPLCHKCHQTYERYGTELKKKLAERCGISTRGYGTIIDKERYTVGRAAKCLLNIYYKGKQRKKTYVEFPNHKRPELIKRISKYIGHEPTQEELLEISTWGAVIKTENFIPYGTYVVSKIPLAEIILMWRKHFLNTMKPKFMPPCWESTRLPTQEEIEQSLKEKLLKEKLKKIPGNF